MSNADVAREWFRRVWCDREAAAIDELLAPDAKLYGLAPEPVGREEFRAMWSHLCELIPDVRIEPQRVIEQGDWVGAHSVVTGTLDGHPIRFAGGGLTRIVEGRAVESHESWDFLGLLVQSGRVDEKTVADLFGG